MDSSATDQEKKWTLIATILASGIVFLSSTSIKVALPAIGRSLDATLSDLQWVIDGYLITLASLLILGGALGDRFGRRRMCLIGLAGFGTASFACGLVNSAPLLIGFRAVQGIAGALMVPESLALIRVIFTNAEKRGQAIGAWSGWSGISTVIGPLLGGFLTDQLSWRWTFFIVAPLAALTFYLMLRFVPESKGQDLSAHPDWLGAAIITFGLGGLTFGLIEGPVLGWSAPAVLIALTGGTLALVVFPFIETRLEKPLLPLSLFKIRNFRGANLTTLGVYSALEGSVFLTMLYVQNVMGYTALQAGMILAPISVLLLLLSSFFGRQSNRHGPRLFMTFGPILSGAGLVLLSRLNPTSNIWTELLPAILVFGLGLATTVAPLTDTVMSAAPGKHSSLAAAFNNMVSRVAALLAVAAFGAILSLGFTNLVNQRLATLDLPQEVAQSLRAIADDPSAGIDEAQNPDQAVLIFNEAFTTGFRQAMQVGAGLAALGGVIAFITIHNPEKDRRKQ